MKKCILSITVAAFAVVNSYATPAVPFKTGGQSNSGGTNTAPALLKSSVTPKLATKGPILATPNLSTWNYPQVTLSPYIMKEWAILGPDKSSTNYFAWSSNEVVSIYTYGHPIVATNSWPLSETLLASYISQQDPGLTNNTLWFAGSVKTVSMSSPMLNLSNLWFSASSSDPENSLGKTNFLSDPSYVFNSAAWGVVYASTGARTSDTILDDATSGPWVNTPINEFDFIGFESVYYLANTNAVGNYINSYTNASGFSTTGSWYVNCSNVVAQSHVTLQTRGVPLTPVQTIFRGIGATNVFLGVNMETNRTIVVQFQTPLLGSQWVDICSMNAGDIITWPTIAGLNTWFQGYFRFYPNQ